MKTTQAQLDKLQQVLSESEYSIRYERGTFQSGWCLLEQKRIVVLNKFLDTEGRINTLLDLIPCNYFFILSGNMIFAYA